MAKPVNCDKNFSVETSDSSLASLTILQVTYVVKQVLGGNSISKYSTISYDNELFAPYVKHNSLQAIIITNISLSKLIRADFETDCHSNLVLQHSFLIMVPYMK